MNAVILEHPDDIKLFNKNDKKLNFYAYNYHTYLQLKVKFPKILYINNKLFLKNYDDFSQYISQNWFKENRGKNLKLKKISIGNLIFIRLLNEYNNSIKNYILFKKILSKNSKLFFPKREKEFIVNILEFFPNKIKFYNSKNSIQNYLSYNHIRSKIIPLPQVHKLSNIARIIQNILLSKKTKQVIYYPEPRTKLFFEKLKKILSLNSLFIWKGFYFRFSDEYMNKSKYIIDFDYQNDLNQFIKNKKNKKNKELFIIFKKCINKIIEDNKRILIKTLAIYLELFEYYKPKSIIFPGVLNFDYAIGTELAKIKKIKTYIALDGVLTNFDKTEFNKDYIFEKIFSWGNENKNLLRNHQIKEKDIILSYPYLKKLKKRKLC